MTEGSTSSPDSAQPNPVPKPEIKQQEIVTDPRAFISLWRQSLQYEGAYRGFFAGKKLAPDVTEEEKREVFEEGGDASQSLIVFAQEGDYRFSYLPEEYSSETQEKFKTYLIAAELLREAPSQGSGDYVIRADRHRFKCHQELARQLVKDGIVPSDKVGRALGRLFLIGQSLDTYSSARKTDQERARDLAAATSQM